MGVSIALPPMHHGVNLNNCLYLGRAAGTGFRGQDRRATDSQNRSHHLMPPETQVNKGPVSAHAALGWRSAGGLVQRLDGGQPAPNPLQSTEGVDQDVWPEAMLSNTEALLSTAPPCPKSATKSAG